MDPLLTNAESRLWGGHLASYWLGCRVEVLILTESVRLRLGSL